MVITDLSSLRSNTIVNDVNLAQGDVGVAADHASHTFVWRLVPAAEPLGERMVMLRYTALQLPSWDRTEAHPHSATVRQRVWS